MDESRPWGVTTNELETAIAAVDRDALLVPARILRRVIKHDCQLPEPVVHWPHRKAYIIARERLRPIVELSELDLAADHEFPPHVILLARLEPEQLSAMTRQRALLRYWRLLFHARIHVELEQRRDQDLLNATTVRERIAKIGSLAFAELRMVLKQEELLVPPQDDVTAYIEFAATYLELRHFAPRLVADYFPTISDWPAIDALLAADVDAERWFLATRLPGCPMPAEAAIVDDEESTADARLETQAPNPRKQSERIYCRFMDWADRARGRGNDVGSALQRWRAALFIGPKLSRAARDAGRDDIEHLAARLGSTLEMSHAEVAEWGRRLAELLPNSIRGIWTPETRFLYDLQKVCLDHERGVYKLDLWTWLRSRGQQSLRRPLPSQGEVLISKHLHAALHRLPALRTTPMARDRLSALLRAATERVERKLRTTFRPRFEAAFGEFGLAPTNQPEIVARGKLIEELLDRIVEFGYLNMGHVRDAISRNQLKLRDVTGWREALRGDQLLRVDRRLAELLDGVYHRGEVYLRWPQSISSQAFGTPKGRWITRYLAIPFGGAYVVLAFIQHMLIKPLEPVFGPHAHVDQWPGIALLGLFFLLLYNTAIRQVIGDLLRMVGRGLHRVFIQLPLRILELPWVRLVLNHPLFRQWKRFVFKPVIWTTIIGSVVAAFRPQWSSWTMFAVLFAVLNVLLNSRWGRAFDELVTDVAARSWHQLRIRVFAAIAQWLLESFQQVLEDIERLLYTVDEWLRFRGGESQSTTTIKAALGAIWAVFNYLIRFVITLLVEPQINPIKHFPVVTVSHKVILPLGPFFVGELSPILGSGEANAIVWSTIWLIPGVFGFLVWELKENWRLYAANRSLTLKPVLIGRHGETMTRLLRWGFHSGTIPKVFSRLRRADRQAVATGQWKKPRKHHERLTHTQVDIRRFVEREFIALLNLCSLWRNNSLELAHVHLGCNNVRLALRGAGDLAEPLIVTFEERAGWLAVRLNDPAWFDRLSAEQSAALRTALGGMYKSSGVDLVHEQIEACLGPNVPRYDLREAGLVVWPEPHGDAEVLYDLRTDANRSTIVAPSLPCSLPTLDRHRLVFGNTPIRWCTWVDTWQRLTQPHDSDEAPLDSSSQAERT